MTGTDELYVPADLPLPHGPPDRSAWSHDHHRQMRSAREAVAHVLDEIEAGHVTDLQRDGVGGISFRTTRADVSLSGRKNPNIRPRMTISVMGYHRRGVEATVPVRDWRPDLALRAGPRGLMAAAVRGAIDQMDAVEGIHSAASGPFQRIAEIHLARLHAGGRLPSWTDLIGSLLLTPPCDGYEGGVSIEDMEGRRIDYVSADGRPAAPDAAGRRSADFRSLPSQSGGEWLDCVSILAPTAIASLRDLPSSPAEIARMIRDPDVPHLVERRR